MLTVTITVADGNDGTGGAEAPPRTGISDTEFELLHKLVGQARIEMARLLDDDPMVEVEIRSTVDTQWGGGARAELKPGPARRRHVEVERVQAPSVFVLTAKAPRVPAHQMPRPTHTYEEPF
jgi:hypothetical protein